MRPGVSRDTAFYCALFLLAASALVSGSIYPASARLFAAASALCTVLALAEGGFAFYLLAGWPALAFLGSLYLSASWTVNLNATLDQAFAFTPLVLFSLLVSYSCGGERRMAFLKVLAAGAAVVSLYGIYQYFAGFAGTERYIRAYGMSEFGMSEGGVKRALSTFAYRRAFSTLMSPNVLACYLAMSLPSAGILALTEKRPARRAAYGLGCMVMLVALGLTKSVGGLLAAGAGAVVFVLLAGRQGIIGRRAAHGALAALVVVGLAAGAAVIHARTGGFFGFERSLAERPNYFSGALGSWADAPVLGNGAGSFWLTYFSRIPPGGGESRYAHNVLLQTLTETGLPGIAALFAVFAAFFIRGRGALGPQGADAGAGAVHAVAALSGGAAFLAHNMVDFTFYVHETAVVFWLYFGLVSGPAARDDRPPKAGNILRAATAVMLAVFCLYYARAQFADAYMGRAAGLIKEAGLGGARPVRNNPPPEAAAGMLSEALSLKPYDDGLHAALGGVYEGMAYREGPAYARRALERYAEAARLNPLYPYHYRDMGILYMKLGDKARAARYFSESLGRYPASPNLAKHLAEAES